MGGEGIRREEERRGNTLLLCTIQVKILLFWSTHNYPLSNCLPPHSLPLSPEESLPP